MIQEALPPFAGYKRFIAVVAEPDRVAPAIEGYFRIPAIWVGTRPAAHLTTRLNPAIHHATAFEMALTCGIQVRVQRDGLFLFDFSGWQLARATVIPGYVSSVSTMGVKAPKKHGAALAKAEDIATLRAQVMNVHQACLTTAERLVARRSAAMGFPICSWNTFKTTYINATPAYCEDPEDVHALAQNVLNAKYGGGDILNGARRVIEIPVVERSLALLDAVLSRNDRSIVELIEAAYISACRFSENRRGECVAIGWNVCEQLVSIAWRRQIQENNSRRIETEAISAARTKKLSGRDYTASVMIEWLELQRGISHGLYQKLEKLRKARNGWAHEMRLPTVADTYACQECIEQLLLRVEGLRFYFASSTRGGVPLWPVGSFAELNR